MKAVTIEASAAHSCFTSRRLTCTCRSVAWSGEAIPLRHDDGGDAQHTHHREVYEAWLWRAVKRVVEPWHKGAHYQQSYTRVIQPKHRHTHKKSLDIIMVRV